MATAPFIGAGLLIANDVLTDCAYKLFEPVVNAVVEGGFPSGNQTIPCQDPSIVPGCQLVVGVIGGNAEVVTVSAVNPGVTFTAVFQNAHVIGDPIVGATFPVQNTAGDYFFSQVEMLTYLSNAVNDFLDRVPLAYSISTAVTFGPTQQIQPLPSDSMLPVRVAVGNVALRETSQANLDGVDFRWNSAAMSVPYTYFRDKVGLSRIGIWPRQANTVNTEIIYAQRGPQLIGLSDGFLFPDIYTPIVKYRTLEFAYSKDGEARAPAVAEFWNQQYETGVRVANMILEIVNDTADQ